MPDGEPEADAENLQTQELAAYRRAEQAERNAMARARKLREQLNLLCEPSRRTAIWTRARKFPR